MDGWTDGKMKGIKFPKRFPNTGLSIWKGIWSNFFRDEPFDNQGG
jgi:hypothetical protein